MGEDLPVGAIITVDGVQKRHLGGGKFEPAGEAMLKRFDSAECRPLGGLTDATTQSQEVQ